MVNLPLKLSSLLFAGLLLSQTALCEGRDTAMPDIDWREPIIAATGGGKVGPWRMNDSEFHYLGDASVALSPDGEAALAWADNERQDIFLQVYTADNQARLESLVNVSRSPEIFSWFPRVVFAGQNEIYIAWQEIVFSGGSHGGEIFFARSTDAGRTFSEPINLSKTQNGAGKGRLSKKRWDNGSLAMALSPEGEIAVAWTEYQGALRLRRSTNRGRSFEPAIKVGGSGDLPARAPALAFGPKSQLYLAWSLGEDSQADIQLALSRDGGINFDQLPPPTTSRGHSDAPDLAVDARNRLHLVYSEHPSGPSKAGQLEYLKLNPEGRALEQSHTLDSGIGVRQQAAGAPAIAVDQQGRVYILWEQYPEPDDYARGLGLSISLDAGGSFSRPQTVPASRDPKGGVNGSLQGQLGNKLSIDGAGGIAISNSHFRLGRQSRILLLRGQLPNADP